VRRAVDTAADAALGELGHGAAPRRHIGGADGLDHVDPRHVVGVVAMLQAEVPDVPELLAVGEDVDDHRSRHRVDLPGQPELGDLVAQLGVVLDRHLVEDREVLLGIHGPLHAGCHGHDIGLRALQPADAALEVLDLAV